jgi:hypothetical protein
MKRILPNILVLVLAISFISLLSCSQRKGQAPQGGSSQGSQDKEAKLDKNEGEKLLNDYMKALVLRDNSGISMFYSQNFKAHSGSFSFAENPHPNGFKVDNLEDKEGKLEGKATILSIFTGMPYFSSDESKFTIIKEKGAYVIDKIESSKTTEIVEKDKALYIKEVMGKRIYHVAYTLPFKESVMVSLSKQLFQFLKFMVHLLNFFIAYELILKLLHP